MSWRDAEISAELAADVALCPRCARNIVERGTVAGDRYGVCCACYGRAKRDAQMRRLSEIEAKREADAARQAVCRARKEIGDTGREYAKPEF